jgi:hypothetical protein
LSHRNNLSVGHRTQSTNCIKPSPLSLQEISQPFVTEVDSQTGENVQKVKFLKSIPTEFRRKVTESLLNTRHAFDQALFAACNVVSGRDSKERYYPWAQDPTDLEHLLRSKHRKIDERLWNTVRSHEPYRRANTHTGGNDLIRSLATLANQKHTIGLGIGGNITMTSFPNIAASPATNLRVLAPVWNSKKNEAELLRWIGGKIRTDGNYQINFEVILSGAALSGPVNAIGALVDFRAKAQSVIESLQARCLEVAT